MELPGDVLEKLADPFLIEDNDEVIKTNDLILTLKIRKSMAVILKNPSLRALNMIIDHLAKEPEVVPSFPFEILKDTLIGEYTAVSMEG